MSGAAAVCVPAFCLRRQLASMAPTARRVSGIARVLPRAMAGNPLGLCPNVLVRARARYGVSGKKSVQDLFVPQQKHENFKNFQFRGPCDYIYTHTRQEELEKKRLKVPQPTALREMGEGRRHAVRMVDYARGMAAPLRLLPRRRIPCNPGLASSAGRDAGRINSKIIKKATAQSETNRDKMPDKRQK